MRRPLFTFFASTGALAIVLTTSLVRAETSYAFETDLTESYTRVLTPFDKTRDVSRHNGGAGLALTVLFRSPYFVLPFADVSYVPMQASQERVDLGSYGGRTVVTSSLRGVGVVAGAAVDLWRFRVRAGIGAYDTIVHATVLHDEIRPSELDLGYVFAANGWLLRVPTGGRVFKVGLEARLGLVTEAAITYVSFGVTIAEDALAW